VGLVSAASDHDTCARVLTDGMAEKGIQVTVSTAPPLVVGPFVVDPFVCPHGVRFWFEPTGEQIAEWVRSGVQ
jgi:hypothetical protein